MSTAAGVCPAAAILAIRPIKWSDGSAHLLCTRPTYAQKMCWRCSAVAAASQKHNNQLVKEQSCKKRVRASINGGGGAITPSAQKNWWGDLVQFEGNQPSKRTTYATTNQLIKSRGSWTSLLEKLRAIDHKNTKITKQSVHNSFVMFVWCIITYKLKQIRTWNFLMQLIIM
jgi:hypothetical protein